MSAGSPTTEDLLEIARRLVDEGGPEALTMDRLAEAAGVSRSTVYRLVGSREALVQQLGGAEVRGVRERVLAAAREVFARHGLEAATIEAVAEAAGVGAATIYRQFGDKKGLLLAFVGSLRHRRIVRDTAREPSGDLAADLERLAVAVLQQLKEEESLVRLVFTERLRGSGLLGEIASAPDRTIHGLAALLRHYAARGELIDEEPYRLARVFQGMLLGFGLFGVVGNLPGDGDPERDAALVVSLFLRGARRAPP